MLNDRSHAALQGVHPDLVRVVHAASLTCPFIVTEGLRSMARQQELCAAGKSQTLRSRHLTGHAVDLVADAGAGQVSYGEADMRRVADAMKQAAGTLGIPLEWGGDWHSFHDTPHFQLPVKQYPAGAASAPGPTIEATAEEVKAEPKADAKPSKPADMQPAPVDWSAVWAAARSSKTVFGGILTLLGALVQWLNEMLSLVCQGIEAAASWAPLQQMAATAGANTKAIGFGLSVFGTILVITRRLDAAGKGKIG